MLKDRELQSMITNMLTAKEAEKGIYSEQCMLWGEGLSFPARENSPGVNLSAFCFLYSF